MNPDGLKSKGSSALPISRGLVDPKSYRNSSRTNGELVNIPVLPPSKVDALGNTEPGLRPVEPEKLVDAVTARSERTPGQRKSVVPRAREKTSVVLVPRSDTGTLAEQAKARREQPTLGNSAS